MKLLSQPQINTFLENGYLKLPGLLDKELALAIQNEIWEELDQTFGIKKEDPSTWRTPPHSPRKAKWSVTNQKLISERFRYAISDLIGPENWEEPSSWGGFLLTFPHRKPAEWTLKDKLWHWDYELHRNATEKALLIFSFFSKVLPQGGGTLIVSGSHLALERYIRYLDPRQKKMKHGAHRKHFMNNHPYFKQLSNNTFSEKEEIAFFMKEVTFIRGVPLQVVELTGEPGDVVFCHPRIIHAPSGINLRSTPRIMRSKFLWKQ